ncbi:MAG TPA: DUF6036 family nucleotidyltransferase [Candidatus Lokiarchaeia archaeon]|nr:DUF6036 family nucleotidyltransferase [Candidatus Lokiarchaeia archaeon]
MEESGLKYVIVGGAAAILKGHSRTTMDVDFILEDDPPRISKLLNSLKKYNFKVPLELVKRNIAAGSNASIDDAKSILRLDLKLAHMPDEEEVLDDSNYEDLNGVQVRIASTKQVLYGKLLYLGTIDDVSDAELLEFNDVLDFLTILKLEATPADLEWLEYKADEKELSKELHRLLELAKKEEDWDK